MQIEAFFGWENSSEYQDSPVWVAVVYGRCELHFSPILWGLEIYPIFFPLVGLLTHVRGNCYARHSFCFIKIVPRGFREGFYPDFNLES